MILSLEPSARAMILAGLPLFPRVLPLGGSSHSPQGAPLTYVKVIWASPSFGYPYSQDPSDTIWASPSHITLAILVRVGVTGDAHITRVLGMGMPENAGMPIPLCHWVHP